MVRRRKHNVAASKRERELARAKHQRQQARRAEARRRARRRAQIGAAAVAVLVVIGGVFALSRTLAGDETSSTSEPRASASATPRPSAPSGDCTYNKLPAGSGQETKPVEPPPKKADTKGSYTAKIVTNKGEIAVRLFADKAPCTVNSFRHLAGRGFFDGTRCHRMLVGAEGVLQCGDPSGTGSGGPGYAFADENLAGASYPRGTVAMANSGEGTNGSQFFLVFQASAFPPKYTPFGQITSGLEILDTAAKGGVGGARNDVPKTKVVIEDVVVSKG